MKTWLHKALSALALVMAVALLGPAPLVAQASNDGPVGVDTSSTSAAALAALYNSTIPGGMSAVQTGINMQNNPGALPPPVDPYLRDALGNLLLDAAGQPIKKPADQYAREVAERQLAIDMAKAAATLAGPANTSTGGSPVFRETTADKVPLTGTNWTTGETEHPFSGLHGEHADLGARLGLPTGTGLWRTTHASGLTVANGRVSVSNQGTGQAGVQAVVGLLGGNPGAPVIGNPSNPTIINMPPVCKCCGGALHDAVLTDKILVGCTGRYLCEAHIVLCNSDGTPYAGGNWESAMTLYVFSSTWVGPGFEPAGGYSEAGTYTVWHGAWGCRQISPEELLNGNPCSLWAVSGTLPAEYSIDQPPISSFLGTTGGGEVWIKTAPTVQEVDGPSTHIQVCLRGHRQDWPCGPDNHDWGKDGGGGGKGGGDKGPGR